MANITMKNQKHSSSKKLTRKRSFKLGLIPMLCSNSDASSPSHSSSSSSGRSRLEELQKVFRHLDQDRDGKISSHELSTFFSAMEDEELRSDEVLTDFFLQYLIEVRSRGIVWFSFFIYNFILCCHYIDAGKLFL
jgi:EF hand